MGREEALAPASKGAMRGSGSASAAVLAGFSGEVCVTVTPEPCLAMRGSLRVMLTDETVGVTACGICMRGGARFFGSSW